MNKEKIIRISENERISLLRELSFLVRADIPLHECFKILENQNSKKRLRALYNRLSLATETGLSLSRSLKKTSPSFATHDLEIIAMGEESANLWQSTEFLRESLERKRTLRQKIVSASFYPATAGLVTLGVCLFIFLYVLPKILPVFQSLSVELPAATRLLLFLSQTIQSAGLLSLAAFTLGLMLILYIAKKVPLVRESMEKVLFHIPVAGMIAQSYNLSQASMVLQSLLKSGATLTDSLLAAAKASPLSVFQKEFIRLSEKITHGISLEKCFAEKKVFPAQFVSLVSLGDRTGSLIESVSFLSEYYEKELDRLSKGLSTVLEPVLMIIIGLIVGLVAVGVVSPMYSLTSHLHG